MKITTFCTALIIFVFLAACDVQSGMSKKGVEKFTTTPTPAKTAVPEAPIDPADVVTVDTAAAGPLININRPEQKKKFNCDKYNRVSINADEKQIEIAGACKQIMINGDKNKVTAAAVSEIVLNGSENNVEYSKYANGKRPFVTDNTKSNTVAKAPPPEKPGSAPKK